MVMNIKRRRKTAKALLGVGLSWCMCGDRLPAQPAGQQDTPPHQAASPAGGFLEIGARSTSGDSTAAKFSEYRDVPSGLFIRNLILDSELPMSGSYFRLQSRGNSEKDLHALASAGVYGRYKVTAGWNRIFHGVATAGRNYYVRSGPGQFTLPSGFQALQGAPRQNLSVERNAVGLGITVTPSEAWDLRLEYSPERRTGFRPSGNTLGVTVLELPEPVEYRTSGVKASAEVAKPKWVVQASSQNSWFRNEVQTLEWSGFLRPDERVGGAGSGRRALPPDNTAQNLALSGALNLARSVRIVATVSPGWMRQNAAFVPFTINSAIQARPDYPALPASGLNGGKQTLMMNYLLTGKVKKQFGYHARYRSYRLDNDTPSLLFSGYVPYDSSPAPATDSAGRRRRSLPYAYRKQNLDLDWVWEPNRTSAARWFYEWEVWDRTYRDVKRSNEHTVGASWDWMNRSGWEVRALMRHSRRRPEQYDPDSFLASFPAGRGVFALPQLPGLRRLDQAARTRNYGTVSVQAPATGPLSLSAAYTVDRAFFAESSYGDLHDLNDSVSGNLSYLLRPSISLFADYAYERFRYAMRSRQRLDAAPAGAANDAANNDWESNLRDSVHTWSAGLNAGAFHNRLTADLDYGFSEGRNTTATIALGNSTMAGFLPEAENYPRLGNRFQRLAASLKFALTSTISYRVEYAYERYGETDLALERAVPFPGLTNAGAANAAFLGTVLPRYRVHILSVSVGYVF
jgi:MtrB/PioB family decaheme-associated outer membrane protein